MTDPEAIAQWLETLHCDAHSMCIKTNCLLFRSLADDIRKGLWK